MLLRVVRAPFVEETALPTLDRLGSLVGNNLIVKRVCFWTLSSVSLSLPTCLSLRRHRTVAKRESSHLVLFPRLSWSFWGPCTSL